nr:class I SAM-dependent methyltransferase [Mycobacterium leprae]
MPQALQISKNKAIAIESEEEIMKYLTFCAKAFRMGYIDGN